MIQTSTLDCGPASLAGLLRGFGVAASYEVLRDLCATDIDGTSINSVEAVAGAAGLDAEQMVVPAEHVIGLPEEYLPAVAVTLLPDGFTHFVVLWARRGRWIEVMDPARGRRRVRSDRLAAELYRHSLTVPAAAWREWAGSDVYLAGLRRRLAAAGIGRAEADALVDDACADPGTAGLSGLDAGLRSAGPGRRGRRRFRAALATVRADPAALDGDAWSCVPVDEGQVELRGAVIVRARTWDPDAADPVLLDRLAAAEPGPAEVLAGVVPAAKAITAGVLAAGAALAAGQVLGDVLLLPFVSPARDSGPGREVLASAALAGTGLLALLAQAWILSTGRTVERILRYRVAVAVARLPDLWVRSRPVSDLAERGHLLHRVRQLPAQGYEAVLAGAGSVAAATLAIALAPATAVPIAALLAVVVAGPLLAAGAAAERDLRLRTLAGTLALYAQDALLGAEAVTANDLGPALRGEHERALAGWRAAARSAVVFSTSVRAGVEAVAAVLATVGLVLAATTEGAGTTLLVGLLAFRVLDAGGRLSDLLRSAPAARSSLARVSAWLRAEPPADPADPGDPVDPADPGEPADPGAAGTGPLPAEVAVRMVGAGLDVGATPVLAGLTLDIPVGAHVGVVGVSGAGKTTFLGVLLGLVEVTRGQVSRAPATDHGSGSIAWVAPETRLWNDTLAANLDYGTRQEGEGPSVQDRLDAADASAVAGRLMADGAAALGEGGRSLSGGEAQRVRLARAFGRPDAALVVLDEPFQGLERDRRRELLTTARSWWAGATLVCATHDVEDTLSMDLVLVLDGGSLVESGPPAELSGRAEGRYRALLSAADRDPFGGGWRRVHLATAQPGSTRASTRVATGQATVTTR